MSFKRLATVAAAASVVLIVAPSGAGALRVRPLPRHRVVPLLRKHARARGGCHITLLAEPRRITSGETPQLFGRLLCGAGVETAGQTVTVYERTAHQLAKVIGTTTTTTGGFYSFIAPAPSASSVFYTSAAGATSPTRPVSVAPQVTLSGPTESKPLFTGVVNRVTFSGTVTPPDAGAIVVLQREAATANEEWEVIQRGVVGPGGVYTLVHVFRIPGDANIRVLVRARGVFTVAGSSSPLSYVISQKENPRLTLAVTSTGAASDPIFYGQSITLKGAVAGGANAPVTLQGRTAGGAFATIATTTANGAGQYSFAQTPLQDTAYKVLGANGTHSAVLFEGVKYSLTAGASVSAAQDGQTLTFTGTVTPYHAGKVVYLERQNASGIGYHVVAVAPLTAPTSAGGAASYSLSHTVFGVGKQVYRVKVPGDPDNEGAASPSFAVQVSPAPPSALGPGVQSPLPSLGTT